MLNLRLPPCHVVLLTNAATRATASAVELAFSMSAPILAVGPSGPQRIKSGTPDSWILGLCLHSQAHSSSNNNNESSEWSAPLPQHARDAYTGCGSSAAVCLMQAAVEAATAAVGSQTPTRHQRQQHHTKCVSHYTLMQMVGPACVCMCVHVSPPPSPQGMLRVLPDRPLAHEHLEQRRLFVSHDVFDSRGATHAVWAPADTCAGVRVGCEQHVVWSW